MSEQNTKPDWIEKEAHGDEVLKAMLLEREAFYGSVDESGTDQGEIATKARDALLRMTEENIALRKAQLGIDPLDEP